MSNQVYANNMEVSCKQAAGKSICAFPDVCMTPPQTPATPPGVPIPYPNTGMASDCTDGSSSVKISGQEVMLKNKSYFKKSSGDEAGAAPMKGVVSHKNTGKVYFKAWSMDVKVEGENVVRHLDITTHNHASEGPNSPPWPYADEAGTGAGDPCSEEKKKILRHCNPEKDWKKNCPPQPVAPHTIFPGGAAPAAGAPDRGLYDSMVNQFEQDMLHFRRQVDENPCLRARRCMLVPKKEKKTDPNSPKGECCPGQTPHHIIDGASFTGMPGWGKYDYNAAACVCAEGHNQTAASHGEIHLRTGVQCMDLSQPTASHPQGNWTRKTATTAGVRSVRKTFSGAGCSQDCLEAQVEKSHDAAKDDPNKPDSPIQPAARGNMEKDPAWRSFARSDMR